MQKKSLICLVVCLVAVCSMMFMSCAAMPEEPTEKPPTPPTPPKEEKTRTYVVAGSSIGGTSNLRASAVSGILLKYVGVDSTVITLASTLTPLGLHEGICDIGQSGSFSNWDAYRGEGPLKLEEPAPELRALFQDSQSACQLLVPVDSDINCYSDLAGKRFAIDKAGSNNEFHFKVIMGAIGILDKITITNLGQADAAASVIAGKVEGYSVSGMPPHPTWTEVDLLHHIRIVTMTQEELDAVRKAAPGWVRVVVSDAYHTGKTTILLGTSGECTTTTALPENVAYGLTKGFMENPDFVRQYYAYLADVIPLNREYVETATEGVPFHVGAIRYYKELGWTVPESRIPPEWSS